MFSACQPLDTSSSNVRFHQSTCAWYDVGLECFCRDTSEYKDCRRDLDVVVYVEHEESDTGAEAMDGQKTRQIWPQIIDHSKSHVPLLLHLLHLFFYRSHLSTPPSGRLRMKLVAFVLLLYGFDPFSNVQGQSRSLNYARSICSKSRYVRLHNVRCHKNDIEMVVTTYKYKLFRRPKLGLWGDQHRYL